jgi:hypothetical protein
MRVTPLLLLCACGGQHPPRPGHLEALGAAPPRLPGPEATIYATHVSAPGDPLLAAVVGDLPWEESLSGAAGALGVELAGGNPADPWTVRWAAYRAGYPHPIEELSLERVPEGGVGRQVLDITASVMRPGDHVGLARVRGAEGDTWVGILGRPRLQLEPVPKLIPPGHDLDLSATGPQPLELTVVSPVGALQRSELRQGRRITLEEPGVWWIEIRDPGGVAASFPVVAGLAPIATPPLLDRRRLVSDREGLELAAWELLDLVREYHERPLAEGDPILGPVARAHLAEQLGIDGPSSGGFPGEPGSCRASASCALPRSEGVERCYQRWLVEPAVRAALVDPRCTVAGIATELRPEAFWIQLELGQE